MAFLVLHADCVRACVCTYVYLKHIRKYVSEKADCNDGCPVDVHDLLTGLPVGMAALLFFTNAPLGHHSHSYQCSCSYAFCCHCCCRC